jgi:hypothetical protein
VRAALARGGCDPRTRRNRTLGPACRRWPSPPRRARHGGGWLLDARVQTQDATHPCRRRLAHGTPERLLCRATMRPNLKARPGPRPAPSSRVEKRGSRCQGALRRGRPRQPLGRAR